MKIVILEDPDRQIDQFLIIREYFESKTLSLINIKYKGFEQLLDIGLFQISSLQSVRLWYSKVQKLYDRILMTLPENVTDLVFSAKLSSNNNEIINALTGSKLKNLKYLFIKWITSMAISYRQLFAKISIIWKNWSFIDKLYCH